MVITLKIHSHLFGKLSLYTGAFIVHVLRSFTKSLTAVTKLFQLESVLKLVKSFHSKLLSTFIPPIFPFLIFLDSFNFYS